MVRPTSSGEIFDMHLFTAAHKTLPLPTVCPSHQPESNGRERDGSDQ